MMSDSEYGPSKQLNILTRNFNIYGSNILDVGCGTGLLADYLNKDKYQILIDGIDINEMIKIAVSNYYDQLSTFLMF